MDTSISLLQCVQENTGDHAICRGYTSIPIDFNVDSKGRFIAGERKSDR